MFKSTTNSLFLWYKGNYFRKKKKKKAMQENKHFSLNALTELL